MPLTTDRKVSAAKAKKNSRTWLWSLLVITGAVILLAGSALAYVLTVNKNIFPNVYADGIRLGGLSAEQAAAVTAERVRERLSGFAVLLTAPDISRTITASEINAQYDAGTTAQNAYNVGRTGSLPARARDIWNAYFSRVDIPLTPNMGVGRQELAEIVGEVAAQIDVPVLQYSYIIGETSIIIRNARSGFSLDQAAVAEELVSRFETLENTGVTAEPAELKPDPFDIETLQRAVCKDPRNAYLDVESQREARIIAHQEGVGFDAELLRRELENTVKPEIIIPLIFTQPEITQQFLQENLFKDELSSFTTYLTASNLPRTGNIRLSANHINGVILVPGDVFSFNETVGQRTAARGFQEAGAYLNGRLVPELGGGVCQMSTTVYNAALFSNLKIVERFAHSMTVAYVPLGQDAMVNWGSADLRFENDRNYPLQILAVQSGGSVTVTVMGTKEDDNTVSIERAVLSSTPYSRVERLNPDMPAGSSQTVQDGHTGYVVDTFRVIKDADGNVLSREYEVKSRYNKTDQLVDVGPAAPETPEPEPSPGPSPEPDPSDPTPAPMPDPDPPPVPTPGPLPEPSDPTPYPLPIS